mmetsp:Transcript_5094/g.14899  ORF Transcript_5094/g.14899 Transcript_5094/m.14899 type:complete len:219 (-) Transcript_5094:303-959(-)
MLDDFIEWQRFRPDWFRLLDSSAIVASVATAIPTASRSVGGVVAAAVLFGKQNGKRDDRGAEEDDREQQDHDAIAAPGVLGGLDRCAARSRTSGGGARLVLLHGRELVAVVAAVVANFHRGDSAVIARPDGHALDHVGLVLFHGRQLVASVIVVLLAVVHEKAAADWIFRVVVVVLACRGFRIGVGIGGHAVVRRQRRHGGCVHRQWCVWVDDRTNEG